MAHCAGEHGCQLRPLWYTPPRQGCRSIHHQFQTTVTQRSTVIHSCCCSWPEMSADRSASVLVLTSSLLCGVAIWAQICRSGMQRSGSLVSISHISSIGTLEMSSDEEEDQWMSRKLAADHDRVDFFRIRRIFMGQGTDRASFGKAGTCLALNCRFACG